MSGGGTKRSGTLRPAQGTASGFRPQSWRQFWESGFETELYRWEDLPIGRRRVILEASAWHRNCAAVVCFLRDLDSEQRYRITVFRDRETESYGPQGLNFSAVLPWNKLDH